MLVFEDCIRIWDTRSQQNAEVVTIGGRHLAGGLLTADDSDRAHSSNRHVRVALAALFGGNAFALTRICNAGIGRDDIRI